MGEYIVRRMQRAEVDLAVDWAAGEGWNPGLHDAECFWSVDPQGWWIGLLDGEPIVLKSAVAYDDHFGFMGFYITRADYRGHGYGFELWKQANASLAGRNVGMDGVVAQQENYKKSGYRYAYRQMRYEGEGTAQAYQGPELVDLKHFSLDALSEYDRRHFPAERKAFLRLWISRPGTVALGRVEGGELKGYGVLRPCRTGFKIGPLFADTPEVAAQIFDALRSRAGAGQPIYLDVPEPNLHALALVEKHGMKYVFETARMYTQDPPAVDLNMTYGVTSFELG